MSYFFGQIIPVLIKISHHVGYTLGLSTLGSFLGAIIPSLVFMHFFGVNATISINIFICCVVLILLNQSLKSRIMIIILTILGIAINITFIPTPFVASTEYADYEVVVKPKFGNRFLMINKNNFSSLLTRKNHSAEYNNILQDLILKDSKPLSVLILGAGGFTLSQQNSQHHYTYVDIDPQIKEIVKKHFNPEVNGNFIAEDAFSFLLRDGKSYALIMQDIYSAHQKIPERFKTIEFFFLIKKHLNPDGYFAINYVHSRNYEANDDQTFINTLRKVFPFCYDIPAYLRSDHIRSLLICPNTQKHSNDHFVLDKAQ